VGPEADRLAREAGAPELDLAGYVLLPAAAETHAHLDKALLADRVGNPSGDLLGAIEAVRGAYSTMTGADVASRARRALRIAVSRGFSAIRTHVSCEEGFGTGAIEALVALRDDVRDTLDLQVIAMAGRPFIGRAGELNRRLLAAALRAGADGVGGAPALDDDPPAAVDELVHAAADAGLPVDLHLDETLDPHSLTIVRFIEAVERHGLAGRAAASHCVSLGQLDVDAVRSIAERLARNGIAVVTLPQTNLYLQGRDTPTRVPRALTAIAALRAAGVVVAGGGDNWRDPFNPLSRIDPFETASLLVTAGHLPLCDAFAAVSTIARQAIGLPDVGPFPGAVADLLAVRARNFGDAIAHAGEDRVVLRHGRVVSRTHVEQVVVPDL
jgi:cytosine deaminase